MIQTYKIGNKTFKLFDDNIIKDKNIYTIIIGKNGSGKSRMVSSIAEILLDKGETKATELFPREEIEEFELGKITKTKNPKKIITVSTSPFDKFPITRFWRNRKSNYKYIGLREHPSYDFGLSFMSKIINNLINISVSNKKQYSKISNMLHYLGYGDEIKLKFEYRVSIRNLSAKKNIGVLEIHDALKSVNFGLNRHFFYQNNDEFDNSKINKLIELLNKKSAFRKTIFEFEINKSGMHGESLSLFKPDDICFLIESGILKLREFYLRKKENARYYKLNEASSGEQCVVTSIIGITCNIENNSVIFIDEPEISLHPEWQERYIKLLTGTFKNFKNCHFIIATHSPQIISNLPGDNCFILNMETAILKNSNQFINHSADYQLAVLFNSPGFKNEYLSKIALQILSKVAKTKIFDELDILNHDLLISQKKQMNEHDPLLKLIDLIKDLKIQYA